MEVSRPLTKAIGIGAVLTLALGLLPAERPRNHDVRILAAQASSDPRMQEPERSRSEMEQYASERPSVKERERVESRLTTLGDYSRARDGGRSQFFDPPADTEVWAVAVGGRVEPAAFSEDPFVNWGVYFFDSDTSEMVGLETSSVGSFPGYFERLADKCQQNPSPRKCQ